MSLKNISSSPSFKIFKQCICYVMFVYGVKSRMNNAEAEMWPVNAQLYCGNYKWQLHVSASK
jgi:hypothetical protein